MGWFFKDVVKKVVEDDGASPPNLALLDDALDEISFAANILVRYCNFVGEGGGATAQLEQLRQGESARVDGLTLSSFAVSNIYIVAAYEKAEVRLLSFAIAKAIDTSEPMEVRG